MFTPRHLSDGRICCSRADVLCDACRGHHARSTLFSLEKNMEHDDPPDPYAAGISALRAAESTPESRFAERYANMRRREFQLEAATDFMPLRLTAAEEADLAAYEPPDAYAAGIKALHAKQAR